MSAEKEIAELREAGRDLAYTILKNIGMVALVRRLGMQPKAWILEREQTKQ